MYLWALGSGIPCHPEAGLVALLLASLLRALAAEWHSRNLILPPSPVCAELGDIYTTRFIYLESMRAFCENRHLLIQVYLPSAWKELRLA